MSIFISKYDGKDVPCGSCGKPETNPITGPKLNVHISGASDSVSVSVEVAVHYQCLKKAIAEGLAR